MRTKTTTGSPNLVPGANCRCLTALTASLSRPNTVSIDRVTRTSPTAPSGSPTTSSQTTPPVELGVGGFPHFPHPAFAQFGGDRVVAEPRTDC